MSDIKMTPEVKEFLTSRAPFSSEVIVEYTPPTFLKKKTGENESEINVLPDDFIPVFKLRSLRRQEKETLRKALQKIEERQEDIKNVCRKAVLGWERYYDPGSEDIYPYKADPTGGCDSDTFANIPMAIVSDICFYLSKISGLIDTDKLSL